VSDIKLRQLENKAVEALRRAFSTLRDDAVLPEKMTLPLGEVITDIGTYAFELRVDLRLAYFAGADVGMPSLYRMTTFTAPHQQGILPCDHCGWGVARHEPRTLACPVKPYAEKSSE
jgi:hypothetical protein